MTWAIQKGWRYNAVEVVKETEKMVFYIDRSYRERESRQAKGSFLDWRGERRSAAAAQWFAQRRDEILAESTSA